MIWQNSFILLLYFAAICTIQKVTGIEKPLMVKVDTYTNLINAKSYSDQAFKRWSRKPRTKMPSRGPASSRRPYTRRPRIPTIKPFQSRTSSNAPQQIIKPNALPKTEPSIIPIKKPFHPMIRPIARPVAKPVLKPVVRPVVKPISRPIAKPVVKPVLKPVVRPVVKPISRPIARPVARPVAKPVLKPVVRPVVKPISRPIARPAAKPVLKPVVRPVVKPISRPIARPVARPVAKPVLKPVVRPVGKPVSRPIARPIIARPVAKPVLKPVVRPVVKPISRPIARPVAKPAESPIINPVTAPISKPVAVPVANPVAAPVEKPVAAPIFEPVANPVAAPVEKPVAAPIFKPVAAPVANPVAPIANPVAAPVEKPVAAPVAKPAAAPKSPVVVIVKGPTRRPSVLPPSRRPTFRPSLEPSRPTRTPTREPSRPTLKPTASPSQPTSRPVPTTRSPTYKPTVPIPLRSTKRGMVVNPISGNAVLINCGWYYDYKPQAYYYNIKFPIPYIPMIKDPSQFANYPVGERADVLFTFNEPDVPTSTAYIPVRNLVTTYWPKLVALKPKKIVSPACTKRNMISWHDQFFAGNGTYRPYVDAINVHWHDSSVDAFLDFLDAAYDKYGKPLWVSEFSFADWLAGKFGRESDFTPEDVYVWFNTALTGMERRPFVHGYAYFSSVDLAAHSFASLFNTDRSIRPAGWVYAGYGPNYTHSGTIGSDAQINIKSGTREESFSETVLLLVILFPLSFCLAFVYIVITYRRSGAAISTLTDADSENPHVSLFL